MGALSLLASAAALAASVGASGEGVATWRAEIAEASVRCGVPTAWIERVMRAESAGRTRLNGRPIRSHAGAMGLMQLMPATWAEMRARLGLGSDPDHPGDNILAGTCYLRMMHDRFGYPGLFAAYNAGPARYAEHLRTGRALPAETRGYIASVAGRPAATVASVAVPAVRIVPREPPHSLFVVRNHVPEAASTVAAQAAQSALFAVRNHP